MTKFNVYQLTNKEKEELFDNFYSVISLLKTKEEVKNFFKDLLEDNEMAMFSRRLLAVKMLISKTTFEEVSKTLSMGMDTISKVQRWLQSGKGYKLAISRMKYSKQNKLDLQEKYNPFSMHNLKKKYSLHCWPK